VDGIKSSQPSLSLRFFLHAGIIFPLSLFSLNENDAEAQKLRAPLGKKGAQPEQESESLSPLIIWCMQSLV
jgi:hypothetical protein